MDGLDVRRIDPLRWRPWKRTVTTNSSHAGLSSLTRWDFRLTSTCPAKTKFFIDCLHGRCFATAGRVVPSELQKTWMVFFFCLASNSTFQFSISTMRIISGWSFQLLLNWCVPLINLRPLRPPVLNVNFHFNPPMTNSLCHEMSLPFLSPAIMKNKNAPLAQFCMVLGQAVRCTNTPLVRNSYQNTIRVWHIIWFPSPN